MPTKKIKANRVVSSYYHLASGTYVAYKRDGHWYYTNEDGIEKLCGNHSCLGASAEYKPQTNYNKEIATAVVDSFRCMKHTGGSASDCFMGAFSEAADDCCLFHPTVNYEKTIKNWMKIWPQGMKPLCDDVSFNKPFSKVYIPFGFSDSRYDHDGAPHTREREEIDSVHWHENFQKHRKHYIQTVVFK